MSQPKLGLQLIVYGERPREDLQGVLTEVADAGYAGFEGGVGMFEKPGVKTLNALMAETGLAFTGVHSGYGEYTDLAKVAAHIENLKALGSQYLICSGVAPGEGLTPYEVAAETFNRVGAMCQEAGVVFCYHNHAWEFEAFEGVKGIHRLCELTNPELVKLCIDVYWVHIGKESPADFIRRYVNRAGYYHFKDGAPGSFIELGQGEVDLPAATKAALEAGADWIVCEQDRTELEPKESITQSRAYLKTLGL
ncbi:MAG: sugar phosphate isomerase/epimerase family protein [Candidatus Zipacnadales bacterium]